MREYELMVVLDPNLEEAAVEAVNTRIATLASQRGGSVESVDLWGRKRLAYPIRRHGNYRDGIYVLSRLRLAPGSAAEIERALKLTETVIRHLLVRAEGLATAPAPVAARA